MLWQGLDELMDHLRELQTDGITLAIGSQAGVIDDFDSDRTDRSVASSERCFESQPPPVVCTRRGDNPLEHRVERDT